MDSLRATIAWSSSICGLPVLYYHRMLDTDIASWGSLQANRHGLAESGLVIKCCLVLSQELGGAADMTYPFGNDMP